MVPEEVAGILRAALQAVDEAEIPSELRPVAFAKAFETLTRDSAGQPASSATDRPPQAGQEGLQSIASRLGLPLSTVENAFVIESGRAELVIPPSRFEAAKSRATEQIALLVAAARQGAGLDDDGWTAVDHIREACEHFKRHDSSNFATTIKDMEDVLTVRGAGRDRKVRMTAPAWHRAAELLSTLVAPA